MLYMWSMAVAIKECVKVMSGFILLIHEPVTVIHVQMYDLCIYYTLYILNAMKESW